MSLNENHNKENIPFSPSKKTQYVDMVNHHIHGAISGEASVNHELVLDLKQEILKLERLYKDEVIKCQHTMSEQERLEIEILQKEKQIYQQQQQLQKMTELNKSLSKKLSGEISYYENTLGNYRKMEKEWDDKFRKNKIGQTKFEHMIKKKNDELSEINQELELAKNEIDNKDLELRKLITKLEQTSEELEEMKLKSLLHRHDRDQDNEKAGVLEYQIRNRHHNKFQDADLSSDEEELSSIVMHESEDEGETEESFDISGNSSSLAHEINNKINENDKTIKKYQFEIKSLKNEKHQLYNYINKLLKNKPHPDQNSVLKEKLVKRKILRAISINQVNHDNASINSKSSIMKSGKRVISNIVHFKSYQSLNKRPSQKILKVVNDQNSDNEQEEMTISQGDVFNDVDEDVDEDEIRLIGNQNFGHSLHKSSPYYMMNPIELLIVKVQKKTEPQKLTHDEYNGREEVCDDSSEDTTIDLGID